MRKKYSVIIISIFMLCIILIGCGDSTSSNINDYLKYDNEINSKAKEVLPSLDELRNSENIKVEYRGTHKFLYLFEADSIALVVNFDDETYESEKSKLDEKYKFLKEKVISEFDENKYYIPEPQFSINSYDFRVINTENETTTRYPKAFGMIGTSDNKKSIAYLYFYDFDLDYIGSKDSDDSMSDFVHEYFDYEF